MKRTADEEADRLMQLLDVGIDSMRRGDGEMAVLALKEGLKTAKRLPKKDGVICLPDQSTEESA
jgi:hypothetical protein